MFEKKKNDCIYAVTVRGKGSKELFIDALSSALLLRDV